MPWEALYQELFDTVLQGVVYQDASGVIIAMNPAAERILGKTRDEFLGQTSVSVEHDTLRADGTPFPGLEHPAMVALRTGRVVRDVEMQVYNPREAQYRSISITAVPLTRPGADAPHEVYTIFDDITERKRIEQQMESLARFPAENPNPVLRLSQDGTILYSNDSGHVFLEEWNADVGQPAPADWRRLIRAALRTKREKVRDFKCGERTYLVAAVPISEGKYANLYGRDVTEERESQRALQQARDELETRVRERTSELLQANERLRKEIEERRRAEESLKLEQARLDALLRLSQMSDASLAQIANFVLEQGIILTQSRIGFVGFLNEDESVYTLHAVSKDVVKECNVTGDPLQWHVSGAGIWAEAIRQRKTLFVNDYSQPHPQKKGLPPGHPYVERFMVVPVLQGDRVVAVAGVGNKASDYNGSDERQIALLLSGMWNCLERSRAREALQKAYDELEERVRERTVELADLNAALQQEIVERTHAEQALRESEERYRRLFTSMTEGFALHEALLDADGKLCDYRFLALNPAFETLTGLKGEDLIGRTAREALPDIETFWIETYGRVALTGEPVHFEQYSGPLGRHYEVFSFQSGDNQFAALFRDINERKQAEEAIRRANEEWERTFDSVPDLIAILDDQFHIVRANRAMAERLGLEPKQCVGRLCYECVHGLDGPPVFCPHVRTLADGQQHISEVHEERLEGDFLVSTTPLLDSQGRRIGSVHVARDITERKQAEEALRESEERFRSLAENLPELVWVADADGRATYLNPQYRQYVGAEPSKAEDWMQRVHPEDLPRVSTSWSEAIRTRSDFEEEHRLRRQDGEYRWFLTRCVFKRTPTGEVEGFIGASTDIHDQKRAKEVLERAVIERTAELAKANADLQREIQERLRAEETARAERERFHGILEILPAYIVLLTPDYHGPFANRLFRERFGESQGRRCFEYLFERAEACENCETYRVLETSEPHHWEWLGPDGRNYDVYDFPFTDTDGSRLILEMGLDITEQKQAQLALQASEERFRQLAESIHEAFWMLEPATSTLLYVSPAYDAIWGRPRDELYERPEAFLDSVHPDDRQRVADEFAARWLPYDGEFRIVRPDGAMRWIRMRSFPVLDQQGEVYRIAGVATDVTEQKAAEAALIQAERMTMASKMATAMVHEINNPLQSVIGCLGLAEEAVHTNSDPSRYLEVAHAELQRTISIVGQLRALGRPIQNLRREPTDLNALLTDILTLNEKELQAKKIEVMWEPDAELAPFLVMPDPLRQVFLNLVLNAMDAMPKGGHLRVTTQRTKSPAGVRVLMADSGVGIPADVLPRIFEPFYTTKASGMGVGLFVCQSIINQHGGRIEVESQPGAGTTFTVWLPESGESPS